MREVRSQSVRYHITRPIGQGASGTVYHAFRCENSGHLQDEVAIKVLQSQSSLQEWRQAFTSMAAMQSLHCVRVLGFDWIEDSPALILEYIDGVTLAQLCRSGCLTSAMADEIAHQLRAAVEELHRHGFLHGDLSPGNVLISENGVVKLIDFGLANHQCEIKGTAQFTSPELQRGARASRESDEFSLQALAQFLRAHSKPQSAACTLQESIRYARTWEAARLPPTQGVNPPAQSWHKAAQAWGRHGFFALGLLLLCTGSSRPFAKDLPGVWLNLRFRTNCVLLINGTRLEALPARTVWVGSPHIRLKWLGALGQGQRSLTLAAEEHIVIADLAQPGGGIYVSRDRAR